VARQIDPLDYLEVDALLTDEERAIRGRRPRLRPRRDPAGIEEWFESATFPREVAKGLADLGLLGMHLTGYGCLGANAVSYGLACRELEAGDSGFRSFVSVRARSACSDPRVRQRRAEGALAPTDGAGRVESAASA